MKKKSTLRLILLFVLIAGLFGFIVALPGCANIIPPAGGLRDSLPPVIINISPKDSSKEFKGNRITISFDEFIDIQDVQKNLIVSPIPKTIPAIERKPSSIIVKLKDTLETNTTYTLNFGNAIRDINEGNILKNLSYIFTTGNYFDSLTLRGNVIMAKDGSVDTTLTIILHTNMTDSAIVKEKPRYVTKLDQNGNFVFYNLSKDSFAIYAIDDESNNYRFSGRDQLFAFAQKSFVSGDTSQITLYAFPNNEGSSPVTVSKRNNPSKEKKLTLRTRLEGKQQDLLSNFQMEFETPLKTFDTTKIVFATDSTFTPVKNFRFIQDTTNKIVTIKYNWEENTAYHLILDREFASDTFGNKLLKSDTISFTTKKLSDYGSVKLKLLNIDMAKNPVLLFVQNDNIVDSGILDSPNFSRQLFKPGEYSLRVLYDDNKNGTWDPGIFFGAKKQPELVKPIALTIIVKPNWENEYERNLNAAPVSQPGRQAQRNQPRKLPARNDNSNNP